MNDLSEAMRAAVATPPPSAIDLDQLITTERRDRVRRRYVGSFAGVAAVVAVAGVVVAWSGLPGSGGRQPVASVAAGQCQAAWPTPTASARPWPDLTIGPTGSAPDPTTRPITEAEAAALSRLNGVLNAALAQVFPGGSFADRIHPDCDEVQFEPGHGAMVYSAYLTVTDARGSFSAAVMIDDRDPVNAAGYAQHEDVGDGSVIRWNDPTALTDSGQVTLYRSDGTTVTTVSNPVDGNAPATTTELKALAETPGFTLYP